MTNVIEDGRDYKLATERLTSQISGSISWEAILRSSNISEKELAEMEDVEFE